MDLVAGALTWGVAVPAVAAGTALAVYRLVAGAGGGGAGSSSSALDRVASAIAVALAVGAGTTGVVGWPGLPPLDSTHWLPWTALAGALWVAFESAGPLRRHGAVRSALRLVLAGAAVALLCRPLIRWSWEPLEAAWRVGAWSLLAVVALALAEAAAARLPAVAGWSGLVLQGTATAAALALTGSASLGQLAGALTAGAGAGLVLSAVARRRGTAAGAGLVAGLSLAFLVVAGRLYSELGWLPALALALAPAASWLAARPAASWRRSAVAVALWAAPCAAAVVSIAASAS